MGESGLRRGNSLLTRKPLNESCYGVVESSLDCQAASVQAVTSQLLNMGKALVLHGPPFSICNGNTIDDPRTSSGTCSTIALTSEEHISFLNLLFLSGHAGKV